MESKKAKQRLNLINKTQISMKNKEWISVLGSEVYWYHMGSILFFISLESPIGYFEIYKVDTTYP